LDLLCLVLVCEKDFVEIELCKYASNRPHVDLRGVILLLILEKELWRPEPTSDDIWCQVILSID
jgi:hypothetical protein